jgi:hypothetical protein
LTFEPQLSIRLHESLAAKGVLSPHHGLYRDIYPRLNNRLGDQASKRKHGRVLVSNLQYKIKDVLTQAKRHPHTESI